MPLNRWNWLKRRPAAVRVFQNLDLEVYAYTQDDSAERVRVRVLDSPAGQQGPDDFETVEFPHRLRDRARRLETRDLDREGLVRLGTDLAAVLLPPNARELYRRSLDRLDTGEGLRIRLRLGTWALATLPWEYAYIPPRDARNKDDAALGFLSLNRRLSLVRYEIVAQPEAGLTPVAEDHLRLLALAAEPRGSGDLALEPEMASIQQAASDIDGLHFESHAHASWATLQAALDTPAHIVHFAGHGQFEVGMGEDYGTIEGTGALLFEAEQGAPDPRPAQEVALNLRQTGVRLVMLAACEGGRVDGVRAWSGIAPALARNGIPAVIAMQYRVRDDKATAFSRRFYGNLATGGSIDAAVTAGRLAMYDSKDQHGRDWGVPVLYLNTDDTELFPQPSLGTEPEVRITRRFVANAALTLGAIALALLYYLLHLAPQLSGLQILGGASLPVVLSLLFVVIDRLFDTAILTTVRGWLHTSGATPWLIGACAALFGLGYATSSIYLLPSENEEADAVEVALRSEHPALNRDWTVTDQPEGKILFFQVWRPTPMTLKPAVGSGYGDRSLRLYPWSTLRHRVPEDFPPRRLRLLLLIPGVGIARKFGTGDHIKLKIMVGDKPPVEIRNPPRRSIIIGDHRPEVEREFRIRREIIKSKLRQHLASSGMEPDRLEQRVSQWLDARTDLEIMLAPMDEVRVQIISQGEVIFDQAAQPISDDETVYPVIMRR